MSSTPEIEPEGQTTTGAMPSDTAVQEEQAASAESLAAEVEKYKDAALRARADLDNYRKRVAREKEDAIRYANNSLLESLLPILDNFELGLGGGENHAGCRRNRSGAANGAQATRGLSSRSRRRDC